MSRGGRGPEAIRSSGFNSSARVNAVVISVLIGSSEPGVWVIKTAQTIPNSELWLHQPAASARLERALLAMSEPPRAAKGQMVNGSTRCAAFAAIRAGVGRDLEQMKQLFKRALPSGD